MILSLACLAGVVCGCAGPRVALSQSNRQFEFQKDTFAYANQLVWDYRFETNGHWTAQRHVPKPDYTLHCLVVARSCRQFFENARFVPEEPKTDEATYRRLIKRVMSASPRKALPETKRVKIPGYADLREFSAEREGLLKAGCGGASQSYFARGNWRMIFPFPRRQQAKVAERLLEHLRPDHPLIVHISRFPQLTINHTVLIFGATQNEREIQFEVYDPNVPEKPTKLVFDRASRTFLFPQTLYFLGGRVDAYEMFYKWDY